MDRNKICKILAYSSVMLLFQFIGFAICAQRSASAFDPLSGKWNIEWPGKISQYDVVYNSPPVDPMEGIPLGNGDVAALLWCEDSKIIVVINKCDLFDDAPNEEIVNPNFTGEEYRTTLRHACRLIIDFRMPVFNPLYLSDFKGRLSLSDASAKLVSNTPFGKVEFSAFVDHSSGLFFYSLKTSLHENVPVDVSIERYGSRTFSRWYDTVNRNATIGLSGTESYADGNRLSLTQEFTNGTFAVGTQLLDTNKLVCESKRDQSHRASMQLSGVQNKEADFVLAVTSPLKGNCLNELDNELKQAQKKGKSACYAEHSEVWKSLWNRSFVDYADDYLTNLWYLTIYYAQASQGGKYPGRFNNGLWAWSHDVQNWNFYFHWNQQELYWPLNVAGFNELVMPYLDYRFRSLPIAKRDAKRLFNADGAFFSDVADRRGYNSEAEKNNHTPVAQIALDFWRQYKFTCNKAFLKEKVLPFMLEASKFMESLFMEDSVGVYHAKSGLGYEGWIFLKDGLTEISQSKALWMATLEALKEAGVNEPRAKKWQIMCEHLAPLPIIDADAQSIETRNGKYVLKCGFNEGKEVPSLKIMAAGWGIQEHRMLTVYSPVEGKHDSTTNFGLKLLDGIFPSVPSSPVFPHGIIGLKDKGTDLFNAMISTTLLYGSEGTGWDPVPVVLARLGLADELNVSLKRFPSRWQFYKNGWGHWGTEFEAKKDAELFFRKNKVRDSDHDNQYFYLPMWPFRHMSMESMSVLATAMNESLIQSHEGVIRVFPAFSLNRNGRFTLYAEGGFKVSSEISEGKVQWICIKSLSGKACSVELPWSEGICYSVSTMKKQAVNKKEGSRIVSVKMKANESVVLVPLGTDIPWKTVEETHKPNMDVKYHSSGNTQLGIQQMY